MFWTAKVQIIFQTYDGAGFVFTGVGVQLYRRLIGLYNVNVSLQSGPYSATRNLPGKQKRGSWESGMRKLRHALCEKSSPYVFPTGLSVALVISTVCHVR